MHLPLNRHRVRHLLRWRFAGESVRLDFRQVGFPLWASSGTSAC